MSKLCSVFDVELAVDQLQQTSFILASILPCYGNSLAKEIPLVE